MRSVITFVWRGSGDWKPEERAVFFKRFYPYGSLNWSKATIFENLDRCSATDDNVTKFKITLNTCNNRCETDLYSSLTFSFVVSQYVFEQRPQSSEEMKFRRAYL